MFIYTISNSVNGRKYIGQTFDLGGRWNRHLLSLRNKNHHNIFLQRAWNKYGEDAFIWDMVYDSDSRDEINKLEEDLILENVGGYNIRPGGSNSPMAESTKKLMSKLAKERPPKTYEDKVKASKVKRPEGYPIMLSPDNKEYKIEVLKEFCREHKLAYNGLRLVIIGETFHYKGWRLLTTPYSRLDTKKNISKSRRPNGYPLVTGPDGIEYKIKVLTDFCKEHNLSMGCLSQVVNGKLSSHKGWKLSV